MKNNILNLEHILDTLPHRYPFLMIDRVISVSKEEIIAVKNVTNNEPYFQGHFPDNPIMPGVMILEAMFQTSALFARHHGNTDEAYLSYVTTVDKVKFKKPVIPGDQLYLKVYSISNVGTATKFIGKAHVENNIVAEAAWMSVLVKKEIDDS